MGEAAVSYESTERMVRVLPSLHLVELECAQSKQSTMNGSIVLDDNHQESLSTVDALNGRHEF